MTRSTRIVPPTALLAIVLPVATHLAASVAPAPTPIVATTSSAPASSPTALVQQDEALPTAADLGWMAGRWVAEGPGQYLEETWSPAVGDGLVGMFRWQRQDRTWLYEMMTVEPDEDGRLTFLLRHFSRGLEPWASEQHAPLTYPLVRVGERQAIFENPERDDPRRFIYHRLDDTTLQVVTENAANERDTFHFTLADAPEAEAEADADADADADAGAGDEHDGNREHIR